MVLEKDVSIDSIAMKKDKNTCKFAMKAKDYAKEVALTVSDEKEKDEQEERDILEIDLCFDESSDSQTSADNKASVFQELSNTTIINEDELSKQLIGEE